MNVIFEELEVRQMKENKTDNKLNTRLVPGEITQTSTKKFKLKFTDFAIEKYMSSFGVPGKYRVYTPFDVTKNTILKGLKLCQFFKSKRNSLSLNIGLTTKLKQ